MFLTAAGLNLGSAADGPAQGIPLAGERYVLGDDIATYNRFIMSGGPPPDGIPSIDRPQFVSAAQAQLAPGDLVIGFHHAGEARAYPQKILVHHEIVDDQVGGLSVAITYCPLTATAQGFERGSSTLGVSGQLLNSNLVMLTDGTYGLAGQRYRPDELPLKSTVSVEAFFFAWNAFYPDSESAERWLTSPFGGRPPGPTDEVPAQARRDPDDPVLS